MRISKWMGEKLGRGGGCVVDGNLTNLVCVCIALLCLGLECWKFMVIFGEAYNENSEVYMMPFGDMFVCGRSVIFHEKLN